MASVHRPPGEILQSLARLETEIQQDMKELEELEDILK